jgi:hypothetical protein
MRMEPTEIRTIVKSLRNVARRDERTRPAIDALDAAFDEYTRVDAGTPANASTCERQAMTKAIFTEIAPQLDILDRQRKQLAALLSDVK